MFYFYSIKYPNGRGHSASGNTEKTREDLVKSLHEKHGDDIIITLFDFPTREARADWARSDASDAYLSDTQYFNLI